MARPEFYSLNVSHYCIAVERMLAFKGLTVRTIPSAYDDREELLRRTGQDYVPTLIWNGRTVTWREIPRFLERIRPRPTLFPAGQEGVAETLENWGHEVVEERVWRAVVTEIPPLLGSAHERWIFGEMQTRARGPWEVLKARRAEFRRELDRYFGLVDRMLDSRDWLLSEPSIADFGVYGSLAPWLLVGRPIPPLYRRLRRWIQRVERIGGARQPLAQSGAGRRRASGGASAGAGRAG